MTDVNPQAAPAESKDAPNEHTLIEAITTHKYGLLSKITLKRPKARTYTAYGDPYTVHRTVDLDGNVTGYHIVNDPKAMRGFIADMAGVDPTDIDDLDVYDFRELMSKAQNIIGNPPKPAT